MMQASHAGKENKEQERAFCVRGKQKDDERWVREEKRENVLSLWDSQQLRAHERSYSMSAGHFFCFLSFETFSILICLSWWACINPVASSRDQVIAAV
jgi:hypothetical protein